MIGRRPAVPAVGFALVFALAVLPQSFPLAVAAQGSEVQLVMQAKVSELPAAPVALVYSRYTYPADTGRTLAALTYPAWYVVEQGTLTAGVGADKPDGQAVVFHA